MADLFSLDPQTLATVENGIDSLIHQLGKMCKLIYDTNETQCSNCIFDPINRRSTNRYNGVGPQPFNTGRCPVCHGTGFLPGGSVTTDTVQLLIDWTPKPWLYIDPKNTTDGRFPMGLVSTKGFVADLPKIIQAKYIVIDYLNAKYSTNRFVLYDQPTLQGNIVKSKFFVALWQRYGD